MTPTQPGHIILLNDEAVAGDAMQIALALLERSAEPILHLGLTTLLSYISPPPHVLGDREADGIALEPVIDSSPAQVGVVRGPIGQLLYQALHEMIASLSRSGFSIVVDHAMDTAFVAIDFQRRTVGLPVSRVGLVHTQIASRTEQRSDEAIDATWRRPEVGRWLAQRVHRAVEEDLQIDMSRTTPVEAAHRILQLPVRRVPDPSPPPVSLMTEPGKIIVLNGPTSSGKSSTAHAIQSQAKRPYLQVGGDLMINHLLPFSYFVGQERSEDGWSVAPVEGSDPPENAVHWGPVAVESFHALHRCVANLARMGCNVVMDHGLLDARVNADFRALREELPILFVGLHASLETILERRAPRTDFSTDPAFVALYRWWHHLAHDHGIPYDLELDSEEFDPEACAQLVLERVADRG